MAYEKQTWSTGDLITAEKLNHLEDGISSGSMCITYSVVENGDGSATYTLNKTWNEIKEALLNDVHVYMFLQIVQTGEDPYEHYWQERIDDIYAEDHAYKLVTDIITKDGIHKNDVVFTSSDPDAALTHFENGLV